ncbi:VCBS repeat-containing protein [Algibacter mikhailovii]|uniref:VCBS repeat-containing protein n=1 Tax=Algibacter mikhailovii TaxID=425498 RepID=UPI002494158B|nr:VCBS repeat-containing protein [Algibacter mikhailovii]
MLRFSLISMLLSFFLLACGKENKTPIKASGFSELSPSISSIDFSNNIIENDTLNYFNYPYLYLGSGVSAGDINNDGLTDLYFTGNLVPNKLYLNKGNLKFEDITESAGISGDSRWYSGTTMADVNNDGFLDIYLSVSDKSEHSANQLFINNGDNTFSEQAKSYGLADTSKSIQSTFFDYNNDGLLDVFVANYPNVLVSQGNIYYKLKMEQNSFQDSGHLYKNNGDGTFSDVTTASGVQNFGLTLGIIASDFNNDGNTDLYLSNDFNVPDYLYLNNGDGTFSEVSKKVTRQTSMFGMGVDASDFNNDGLIDILQVDMTPGDYKRSKTNMASMSPETFYQAIDMGFNYQYMQNALQLNNGILKDKHPSFSNIARYAGIATTDWSWGAIFSDFDNDGHKDVFISNGVKRDVNNNDVNAAYNSEAMFGIKKPKDFTKMPSTPISNYAFKNNGDFSFTNSTELWGLNKKGFSNGFSTADLDNDGDLELIVNNIDAPASIYVNNLNDSSNNYLRIKLIGSKLNPFGIGSKITVKSNASSQTQELTLTRGYQSSVETILHFGLEKTDVIEEINIVWPLGKTQTLRDVKANQLLEIDYRNAVSPTKNQIEQTVNFQDITKISGISFKHIEPFYDDFQHEPLLPHKYSTIGPGLAVGDVNNDGLEDFFIGNASGNKGALYEQKNDGLFEAIPGPWEEDNNLEDTGALFFDADNDGDMDLYVVSGGNDKTQSKNTLLDRLYINTPSGFIKSKQALPKIYSSGKEVISADYDNDGDLDLFIGGRIIPGKYPHAPKSTILRNDGGENLNLKFTDVTSEIAPELEFTGMVTSAVWDDYNTDGKVDLIVAGEWMPIRFFKNTGAGFEDETEKLGLENDTGWWYSLEKADMDGDGDLDYLAGNLGLNYKYKASTKAPFEVYANDFDKNGSSDIVLSYKKSGMKLPLRGRECSSQQIPAIAQRFKTYESFANANLTEIYGENMLNNSLHYMANTFAHHWIENKGEGRFETHKLDEYLQLSSINNFTLFDYNNDTFLDVLVGGNLYNSEVETPRNDASIGSIIQGSKDGGKVLLPKETGLCITGEIKDIKIITIGKDQKQAILFARNNNSLKLIMPKTN